MKWQFKRLACLYQPVDWLILKLGLRQTLQVISFEPFRLRGARVNLVFFNDIGVDESHVFLPRTRKSFLHSLQNTEFITYPVSKNAIGNNFFNVNYWSL